jgi:quinol monooxygenase YgiN
MIVRIVRMTFQQGQLEAFEALFLQHREAIAQQPGCLGVEWITDPEAPFRARNL